MYYIPSPIDSKKLRNRHKNQKQGKIQILRLMSEVVAPQRGWGRIVWDLEASLSNKKRKVKREGNRKNDSDVTYTYKTITHLSTRRVRCLVH